MPTLINRGLGLLEVFLPRGTSGESELCLPPGQRDDSGFWFPAGYDKPADIFTPAQRRLQASQRRIQRDRHATKPPPALPPGGDGTMRLHEGAGAAHSPPAARRADGIQTSPGPAEMTVPLPSPLPETEIASGIRRTRMALPPLRPPSIDPFCLSESDVRPREPARRVVDSPEGSD
jgi:hypothetical protein